MPDMPPNDSHDKTDRDDSVTHYVESRLTEERLDRIWERLQETGDRRSSSRRTGGVIEFAYAGWRAIRAIAGLRGLRWGGAIAVFVLFAGIFLMQPSGIDLRARADQKLSGSASLPRNLRIKVHQDQIRIELHEGADSMRGTFTKVPTNVPAGVWLFTGELRGSEGESMLARVHGNLWVTNATGRAVLRSAADVKSASLEAMLEVPNLVPVPVKMEFLPNP